MREPSAARLTLSPRVAESIASDLRQRILRGAVDDANFPRQDDLMNEFGVSGPSVREALRILEAEGLITVRRGKFGGARVHKPSWSSAAYAFGLAMQGQGISIRDLAETIAGLEPMAAAGCARREDRAETIVPALRANLDASERAIAEGSHYSAIAREFHDILVQGLRTASIRLLARSAVAVWSVQEQIWAESATATAQYPSLDEQQASFKTHAKLLHLIEAGDAEAVESLAATHSRATQEIVLARFADEIVDASSLLAVQAFKRL